MIDVIKLLAAYERQKKRREDAKQQIKTSIEACDRPNDEYKRRAARPIAYTEAMVEAEIVRVFKAIGEVNVGYDKDKKYAQTLFTQNPPFRVLDGKVYRYKRLNPDSGSEVIRRRGDEIVPYIKDPALRAAFEQMLVYIKSKDKQFRLKDKGYKDNVEEPKHAISKRTVWRTTSDGYEPVKDICGIAICNAADDEIPRIELLDEDMDWSATVEISEFLISQLRMEIDTLLVKREEIAKKNLKFVRELRAETNNLLGPWLALRNL